jgi:hypothetical protein
MSRRAAPIEGEAFRARFSDGTVSRSYSRPSPAKAAITARLRNHAWRVRNAANIRTRYGTAENAPTYNRWAWDDIEAPTGVVEHATLVWSDWEVTA